MFAPLTHGNHSHHYQKSQMFNYEDGVFVVGTLILMGNGLTASCSFLTEHQGAMRPEQFCLVLRQSLAQPKKRTRRMQMRWSFGYPRKQFSWVW